MAVASRNDVRRCRECSLSNRREQSRGCTCGAARVTTVGPPAIAIGPTVCAIVMALIAGETRVVIETTPIVAITLIASTSS
jgi:hypothetical protein